MGGGAGDFFDQRRKDGTATAHLFKDINPGIPFPGGHCRAYKVYLLVMFKGGRLSRYKRSYMAAGFFMELSSFFSVSAIKNWIALIYTAVPTFGNSYIHKIIL